MTDRVKLAAPLCALLVVLFGAAPAFAERAPVAQERLATLVRGEAAARSIVLRQEEKLDAAAQTIAEQALEGVSGRAAARSALWQHDVRDAGFQCHVILAARAPDDAAARHLLQDALAWEDADVGAVAVVSRRKQTAVVFLVVKRVARFREHGSVALPPAAIPRLVVTDPLGRVEVRGMRAHAIRADSWLFDPEAPTPGRWLFELESAGAEGVSLAAIWLVEGTAAVRAPVASTESAAAWDDPLGLGPVGLGGFGAPPAAVAVEQGWSLGAGRAPDRSPGSADRDAVEGAFWTVLVARREAARSRELRRWTALTLPARQGAAAAVDGGRYERLTERLLRGDVPALHPEEHLLVAGTPMLAWSLLLSEAASRSAILGDKELGSLGVALRPHGPGSWALGLSLVLADGRLALGGSWRGLAVGHLQADRAAHGLPALGERVALDRIATRTAEDVAAAGVLDLTDAARAQLVAEVRASTPQIRGVAVDVLVTTEPSAVAGRAHPLDPAYSEVGVGVAQPGQGVRGQPPGSVVLVLILVQR